MFQWIVGRSVDLVLAIALASIVFCFMLTQPMWASVPKQTFRTVPAFNQPEFERQLRDLEAMMRQPLPAEILLEDVADYVSTQLRPVGRFRVTERGAGQRFYSMKLGKQQGQATHVVLHYIVASPINGFGTQALVSFFHLAYAMKSLEKHMPPLHLNIVLHQTKGLHHRLKEASAFHLDKIQSGWKEGDILLVLAPGLTLPNAVYQSVQWNHFRRLFPSKAPYSLFCRLADMMPLRQVKRRFLASGADSVSSLCVPVNYATTEDSALHVYWDQRIPAVLFQPNLIRQDSQIETFRQFVQVLFQLIQTA